MFHMFGGTTRNSQFRIWYTVNCDCAQYLICWYARNRSLSMGVRVMLWMVGVNPAVIVSFDTIIVVDTMRPLEEMLSLFLEDLSSIEANRWCY